MTAPSAAAPGASPLPAGPKQGADQAGTDVSAAIAEMAVAVQQGDFAAAEAAGSRAAVPLALPRHCLRRVRPISEGAQAAVHAAELSPARLVAGPADGLSGEALEGGMAVAVKKPVIRESAGGWVEGLAGLRCCSAVLLLAPATCASLPDPPPPPPPPPADLDRFRHEVALLARLRGHPGIVHLLGARLLPPGARGRGPAALAWSPAGSCWGCARCVVLLLFAHLPLRTSSSHAISSSTIPSIPPP